MVHCVVKDSLSQCGFYPEDLFKIISYQVSIFHCELVRGVWFNHQPVNFFHRLLNTLIFFRELLATARGIFTAQKLRHPISS